MTEGRWSPGQPARIWPAGEYTLLEDSYTTTKEGVTYSKGDTLSLREREATRLGNAGAIASPDGMQAVRARVEGGQGSRRDQYLYRMWELAGEWDA
jgi:hypothetical protein